MDSGGNLLDVNKQWLRAMGYSKDEVLGRCFADFVDPEQATVFAQRFPQFKTGGTLRSGEFEMIRKDGSRFFASFDGNIEYDADGRFRCTHCIMHDITDRKIAEKKLHEEALMRETLLDNLPCVAMILKKGTREIVASNEAARKVGAVPGKTCYTTCAGRDDNCPFCLAPSVWEDNKPRQLEVESSGRHFEGIWIPLTDELYAHYIFDITNRKKAEQALIETKERLSLIFDFANDGIIIADRDCHIFMANITMCKMLGYTQEEVRTLSVTDIYDRTDAEFADEQLRLVAEKKIPVAEGIYLIRKDGSTFPTDIKASEITLDENTYIMGAFRDISERRKAEQILTESENKYRAVVENAGEGIIVVQDGMLRFVNPQLTAISGYSQEEVIGRLFTDFLHQDDRDMVAEIHTKRLNNEETPPAYELRIIDKNGNTRWMENNGILIEWNGRPASLNFLRDVTDRKKAEQEREDIARFPSENPYPVLRITRDVIVSHANSASLGLLEAFNSGVCQLAPDAWQPYVRKALDSQMIQRLEVEHDGRIFSFRAVPIPSVGYVNLYGTDITEQNAAQQELMDRQERLKSLASELSLTEERERHRLATSLHDQIGQSLVLSKIKLDLLRKTAATGELTGALEEVCNYLAQVIQETRTLTFDLSSPLLYELGLEAAIAEWLTDEVNIKHGIPTEFSDDGQDKPLDDDIRTILFRNVRELLINTVKHAGATLVKVSVQRAGDYVNIQVEDDGVGFDPAEVKNSAAKKVKFGLFSIRERLEQLGGEITIDSSPGNGCRITMTAPLKKSEIVPGLQNN